MRWVAISEEKYTKMFNMISGLVIILFSIIILVFSTVALLGIMILLSITFIVFGTGRLSDSFSDEKLNRFGVIARFITGLLAILIGIINLIIALVNPSYSILLLINIFAMVLFIIGITRIFIGVFTQEYSKDYRIFLILIGLMSLILSLIVMIVPYVGYYILVLLLSLALLLNGLIRFLSGLFKWRHK